MPISLGNTTTSGKKSNVTTFNWLHTCDANTTVLVVFVAASDSSTSDMDVTGVTYGGTPLTHACGAPDATSLCNAEMFYLGNPTTESSLSIEVTFNAKTTNATGFAQSLLGADGSDPVQDTQVATGSNSDPTATVAGAVSGSMTLGTVIITEAIPANLSVSVGTELEEIDLGAETASSAYIADTGTLTWEHTTDDENWVIAAANFNAGATPEYAQPHFRIRSGDAYGLNVDNGWAAALDTNATIDVHTRFRLRLEIEETAGVSDGGNTHKLQWRKGVGSWGDITPFPTDDPASATSFDSVNGELSSQYAHSDATTNLLSGSAKTFQAGDGVEGQAATPSITLNNQHTEVEYCVMIHGLHWTTLPVQNVDGDTFEFRMVEGDGTVYTGSYTNPTITLNVPSGYVGGCFVEMPQRIGPFIDTNDNMYLVVESTHVSGDNTPCMMKSTDDGVTWLLQDAAGGPTTTDCEAIDIVQNGDTLYIGQLASTDPWFHTYTMSDHATTPDEWVITDESIEDLTASFQQHMALERLTTGEIRAAYTETVTNEDIQVATRNGSWAAAVNLAGSASGDLFGGPVCVRGESDKVHYFYTNQTLGNLYHDSLSSGDVFSGAELVDNDVGSSNYNAAPAVPPIYWDNGGVEEIMVVFRDDSDGLLYSVVVSDDGSPESRKAASDNTVSAEDETDAFQTAAALSVEGSTAWLLYIDLTNKYLYITSNENDGSWDTDVLVDDTISANWVTGEVLTHSGGKVFAYFYEDGTGVAGVGYGFTGYIWYGEYEIAAGFPPVPGRVHRDHRNVLLRM